MDASVQGVDGRFAENDAKSPEWKKIYADMRAFQRDQIPSGSVFAEARTNLHVRTEDLMAPLRRKPQGMSIRKPARFAWRVLRLVYGSDARSRGFCQ